MNQGKFIKSKKTVGQGLQSMKMKFILGLLALCIVARSYADTLCNSKEQAIFSCTVAHHKMASLCAPKDLKAPGLYLQYRFGTHQKMELVYPEEMENPQHRFRSAVVMTGPMSVGQYIVFSLGKHSYYMYDMGQTHDGPSGIGIALYKQDRLVFRKKCIGFSDNSQLGLVVSDGDYNPFEMPRDLSWENLADWPGVLIQSADSKYFAIADLDPYKNFRADMVVPDSEGWLWVSSGDHISKLMPDGKVVIYAGKLYNNLRNRYGFRDGNGVSALFGKIGGFVLDEQHNIYVNDWGNNLIRKIVPGGYVSTLAGIRGLVDGAPEGPHGVASVWGALTIDGSGDLMLLGFQKDRLVIRRIDENGTINMVVDKKITLIVNNKLIDVTEDNLRYGELIADSKKNVYSSCHEGGGGGMTAIMKIHSSGDAAVIAGDLDRDGFVDGKKYIARFGDVRDMVVDKADNIFVADAVNHSVRKITPQGNVSTYLDLNKIPGMSLSTAYLASIGGSLAKYGRMPQTLALDDQHNLYVTASFGYTDKYLFKVTPSGQVITLWSVTGPNKVVYFRHGSE